MTREVQEPEAWPIGLSLEDNKQPGALRLLTGAWEAARPVGAGLQSQAPVQGPPEPWVRTERSGSGSWQG